MSHVVSFGVLKQAASRHTPGMARLRLIFTEDTAPTHVTGVAVVSSFTCAMAMCERQCQNSKELIAHLKSHIVEGHVVTCPVRGCTNTFRVKSSFTAHMSRKHRVFRQQHW